MTALGEVIRRAKGDRTFADLAARSDIRAARWGQLAHGRLRAEIPDEMLAEMAAALDVPETDLAVAMYVDLYGDDPTIARRRIAKAQRLAPAAQQLALLADARHLDTPPGEMPTDAVLHQVSARVGLPANRIRVLIREGLDVETADREQHPEDWPQTDGPRP